jgi:hypothetical protein
MQFDKVSLFYVAPDATLRVETIVSANGQSCRIDGQPMIEITGEVLQLGCIRVTLGALRALTAIADSGRRGLIQEGDYRTADPNTRREHDTNNSARTASGPACLSNNGEGA